MDAARQPAAAPKLDYGRFAMARRKWEHGGGHASGEPMPSPAEFPAKPAA